MTDIWVMFAAIIFVCATGPALWVLERIANALEKIAKGKP